MMQLRIPNKLSLAFSLILVAGSVVLLIDPSLTQEFRPEGAAHGPVLFDNPSPTAVRIYAAALLLLGFGIALSSRPKPRD